MTLHEAAALDGLYPLAQPRERPLRLVIMLAAHGRKQPHQTCGECKQLTRADTNGHARCRAFTRGRGPRFNWSAAWPACGRFKGTRVDE